METFNAFKYVLEIYGLTFLVTLFVVVVILGIRWASKDRIKSSTASIELLMKREEAAT
jgi:hypothetical protein